MSTPSQATVVNINEFVVVRGGTTIFSDDFIDTIEPPSAPNFSNGAAASYFVQGIFPDGSESGGSLQLNTANGALTANAMNQARQSQGAMLLTSNSSGNANALDVGSTLDIYGIFSLTTPVGPLRNGYSIQVGDFFGSVQHVAELQVSYDPITGLAVIRYLFQDFDNDLITTLGLATFAPPAGADGILLRIFRPDASNDAFLGSYEFLQGSTSFGANTFAGEALLFDGEDVVRARFLAFTAVPEPGTLALLGLGLAGLAASRRRKQ